MKHISAEVPLQTLPEGPLPVEELFLLHLRYKEANLVEAGGNHPILLTDPEVSWVVYTGHLDVFAVRHHQGQVSGVRTHLFRVSAGQAVFGVSQQLTSSSVALLAVGGNQTRVLQVRTQRLQALAQEAEFRSPLAAMIDHWVHGLSSALAQSVPPKESLKLEPETPLQVPESGSVSARRGILWVQHLEGKSSFMGDVTMPTLNGIARWPVSHRIWVQTLTNSQLQAITTDNFIQSNPAWHSMALFNQAILSRIGQQLEKREVAAVEQLRQKLANDQTVVQQALTHLASPLTDPAAGAVRVRRSEVPLLSACQLIGDYLGLTIVKPQHQKQEGSSQNQLDAISRASHLQKRGVRLRGTWYQADNGPLLAFVAEDGRPVALLPTSPTAYALHDPGAGIVSPVTPTIAATLEPMAYMFYRSFPTRAITLLDLLRFGLKFGWGDLRLLILSGVGITLLGLLIPVATGYIFDQVLPVTDRATLWMMCLGLTVAAVAVGVLRVAQNIATLRLQGRLGSDIQAAVWDRLMGLPVAFFRQYTAGDLGGRAMGVSAIQQTLSGSVISASLSGVFSIFSFFLLYAYSPSLAWVGAGLVAVAVAATILTGYAQIPYTRQMAEAQGRISGLVLQILAGLPKFRAAGAEGRAFAAWAEEFGALKRLAYGSRNLSNRLVVFHAGYNVVASMALFGMVAWSSQAQLSTGAFLAFNVAFAQFLSAVLMLGSVAVNTLSVLPAYERAQPILRNVPEVDNQKESPGELTGRIQVSRITFRYSESGPPVLQDVSLEIEPGEFVALVGPSGSGKSTLLRLLLGFETPTSGAIYYDGQDLTRLDLRATRRQIGVVLQNGKLIGGSIFINIVGALGLTLKEAWNAAEMAGLAEDIKQMPMGMHTIITDGGSTLSGGQRQRLLIARAIVNRPRILYFDEATSALDNRTQAMVSESLENLQATRLVVAHRLSTIEHADKIFVMENGRIVQSGKYAELVKQPGLFADLARRQTA